MKTLSILAIAASAFGVATAQDIKVEVEAWMLETDAGTEHVYEMLTRKAKHSCKGAKPASRIQTLDAECAADLLNQFVEGIGHPRLTSVHTGDIIRLAEVK